MHSTFTSEKNIFKILFIISCTIILITGVYGIVASIIQGVEIVGSTLVNVHIVDIPILVFLKPITLLFGAIVVFVFSGLELYKEKFRKFSNKIKNFTGLFAFFVGSLALYEVLFNFTIWTGLIASDAIIGKLNPDMIISPFPNPETPWNLVFATKIFLAITIISFYYLFFMYNLEKRK